MGRPSKLSPEQWGEIAKRMAGGESPAQLSREFGISQTQISRRVSQVSQKVSQVARRLASAQNALAGLPPHQQYAAVSLAEKLRSISGSLASAADLGAKTAHRLQALANSEVEKVDDADPLASLDSLKSVGVLTKLANDSSLIARDLLAANKQNAPDADDPFAQFSDEQLLAIANGR